MGKKPTQAEAFWQAEEARWRRITTPIGTSHELTCPETDPVGRLLTPDIECAVDTPIREAINKGFLDGDLHALRESLAVVCAMAWGAAAAIYAARRAAPEVNEQREKAERLARELRGFLASVEKEAYSADALAGKAADCDAHSAEIIDGEAAGLFDMLKHGVSLIPLLEEYAKPDIADESASATDHRAHQFFNALGTWWDKNAIAADRRGATAVRNRLAIGLWQDFGQTIPDGYPDDHFARRGFGLGKIDR